MRIFLLSDARNPHTIKWVRGLAQHGHELFVFSLNPCAPETYAEYPNVTIECACYSDKFKKSGEGAFRKLLYLTTLKRVKRLIQIFKPDVLHSHFASSYGLLGALSGFHPYFVSVWGADVYDFPKRSPLHRRILEFNLSSADRIFSTSEVMATQTQAFTKKHIEVIPFGVDLESYKPKDSSLKLFPDGSFVIGTVKSLEDKYGITYLLDAFASLKSRYQNLPLKLLIVGRGMKEAELKQKAKRLGIEEDTIFTGFIPVESVPDYHNLIDIAVFPSVLDSESFGVSAVEASACGKPVVVSRKGGLPEVVEDGKTGLVVPAENPEELARALGTLIENKDLRQTLGEQGRERVKKLYDWKNNLASMIRAYESLKDSKALKVAFVLMKFPVPSETFISNDVREIINRGTKAKIFTILSPHRLNRFLIRQWGLRDLEIFPSTLFRILSGLGLMLSNPLLSLRSINWIFSMEKNPINLLKGLVVLPVSFRIVEDIRLFDPQVVHLLWGHYPSIAGWLVKQQMPQKTVSMFLGAYDLELGLHLSGDFSRAADVVWTHAEVNRKQLIALEVPNEKIRVVQRGVNLRDFPRVSAKKENIIVSAGRLIPSKGFDQLLKVFKVILQKVPTSKLIIIGDGPALQSLMGLADQLGVSEHVEFTGHLSQSDVYRHMSRAKVFALLTKHKSERLPNVVKEAMMCGCVCLASQTFGIEELVKPNETGFVVNADDIDQVANLSIDILLRHEDFEFLSRNARDHIMTSFDRSKATDSYLSTWKELNARS